MTERVVDEGRRRAANEMLAGLYAESSYRCKWCSTAARHPHIDWCGKCEIPEEARVEYASYIAGRLGKPVEDILAVWPKGYGFQMELGKHRRAHGKKQDV